MLKKRDNRVVLVITLLMSIYIGVVVDDAISHGISFPPIEEIISGLCVFGAIIVFACLIAWWVSQGAA